MTAAAGTVRSRPSTAVFDPYRFTSPRISTAGSLLMGNESTEPRKGARALGWRDAAGAGRVFSERVFRAPSPDGRKLSVIFSPPPALPAGTGEPLEARWSEALRAGAARVPR
ncbi:hypothetical protein GCM10010302_15550 [Streptomyces polychromogenes]|uniref:Uncharacterized protein n=1 Tax=Streptomyces polychromogenes TaxID=67342 RepID=A0ABP3EW55_9ACTN